MTLRWEPMPKFLPGVKGWGVHTGAASLVVCYDEDYPEFGYTASYRFDGDIETTYVDQKFRTKSEAKRAAIEAARKRMS